MKYRINASYRTPEDLAEVKSQVRDLTSRKILRFLDAASFAPFLAAAAVYRLDPTVRPEHVALYTVGGWDGDMPDQPFVSDGTADSDALISRHILEEANPVNWLRMLSNNPLCQVSISEGFRGPNAHLVGGPDALAQVLGVASADLAAGAAEQAIVLAYDTAPADRRKPSGRAPTSAAALSIVPTDGEDVLPRLFDLADLAANGSDSALDVLHACIETLATPRPVESGAAR
ncbi:MAG TPA: hypothetical protein VHZ97_31870 [Pseudonocardiaceae bacterium]|nr:hypothetical protein [Pseudonocardiaceae bacterium]